MHRQRPQRVLAALALAITAVPAPAPASRRPAGAARHEHWPATRAGDPEPAVRPPAATRTAPSSRGRPTGLRACWTSGPEPLSKIQASPSGPPSHGAIACCPGRATTRSTAASPRCCSPRPSPRASDRASSICPRRVSAASLPARRRIEAMIQASGLPFAGTRPSFITGSDRQARGRSSVSAPRSATSCTAPSLAAAPRARAAARQPRARVREPDRSAMSKSTVNAVHRASSRPPERSPLGRLPVRLSEVAAAGQNRRAQTNLQPRPQPSRAPPRGSSASLTSRAAAACASPKPSGPTIGSASSKVYGAPKPNIVPRCAFNSAR